MTRRGQAGARKAILVTCVFVAGCLGGCTASGGTASIAAASASATLAVTPAPATPTPLLPPAAPGNPVQTMNLNPDKADAVEADYTWTAPAGQVDGYYFYTIHAMVGVPSPRLTCGPDWTKLPASPATYRLPEVQAALPTYICAFNSAGTSNTVEFQIKFGPGVPN